MEEHFFSFESPEFETIVVILDASESAENDWIGSGENLAKICQEIVPPNIDGKIFERSPEFQETHDEIIKNFSVI